MSTPMVEITEEPACNATSVPASPSADEPRIPNRRRASSRRKRVVKNPDSLENNTGDRPHLTIPIDGGEVACAPLTPLTPCIDDFVTKGIHELIPQLLPEFKTALTIVQILGGGALRLPGEETSECTLLSVRSFLTQSWLLLIRGLYLLYILIFLSSLYYLSISPLPNVTIFWPSVTLNLVTALTCHILLNKNTDKLYFILATLSARKPNNVKTFIVLVLASMTTIAAMGTLRFYEISQSHRNIPLTGSKYWTVYSTMALYYARNFESFFLVGTAVFVMILYALIAIAIKFELRAIIEEPIPHESSLIRHNIVCKLIAYSDSVFSPLCFLFVASVIANISEGLGMARYHQTEYFIPHIVTWTHAAMLTSAYFAVCECSFGVYQESTRVRDWIIRRNTGDADILRYLHQIKCYPKYLYLWDSIMLSRQAMVITVAFPVTLYAIIVLIMDPGRRAVS